MSHSINMNHLLKVSYNFQDGMDMPEYISTEDKLIEISNEEVRTSATNLLEFFVALCNDEEDEELKELSESLGISIDFDKAVKDFQYDNTPEDFVEWLNKQFNNVAQLIDFSDIPNIGEVGENRY